MKYDSICRHNFKKGTGGEKEKKGTKSDELGIIGLLFQHILSFAIISSVMWYFKIISLQ